MTTTTTFSVTYEVPVSPERLAQLEDEIARVADSEDAESRLARLANQMLPEKRTEPARQEKRDGRTEWLCRCGAAVVFMGPDGSIRASDRCVFCGAEIHREDHPMSLDLYRMRTRRNDGVEIQAKP